VGSARLYQGLQGQARSASHERNRVRDHALVAQSRSFQLHLTPRCMRARTNHLHHRSHNDIIHVSPAVRVFWCRSRSFVVLLNTPLRWFAFITVYNILDPCHLTSWMKGRSIIIDSSVLHHMSLHSGRVVIWWPFEYLVMTRHRSCESIPNLSRERIKILDTLPQGMGCRAMIHKLL
jgi:hypothetical protein